jgi:hypothetical protein
MNKEERAFYVMVRLMHDEKYAFRKFMIPGQMQTHFDQNKTIFCNLLEYHLPHLLPAIKV